MSAQKKAANAKPADVARQVDSFIAKFDTAMAKQIREVRAALRKRFPTAVEMVYDNYNFFVIGYCATEKPSDCICSLAANSKSIGLSFYYGAELPDPYGILEGSYFPCQRYNRSRRDGSQVAYRAESPNSSSRKNKANPEEKGRPQDEPKPGAPIPGAQDVEVTSIAFRQRHSPSATSTRLQARPRPRGCGR